MPDRLEHIFQDGSDSEGEFTEKETESEQDLFLFNDIPND